MTWTAADYRRAKDIAFRRNDWDRLRILARHYPHADHCGGWDVYAWPCPRAAQILDRLLGDGGDKGSM